MPGVMLAAALAIALLAAPGDIDLVSRGASASGNGSSQLPAASTDGNVVAFTSAATNLTSDGATGTQAYVRDIAAGTTTLASRADGASGAGANAAVGARRPRRQAAAGEPCRRRVRRRRQRRRGERERVRRRPLRRLRHA